MQVGVQICRAAIIESEPKLDTISIPLSNIIKQRNKLMIFWTPSPPTLANLLNNEGDDPNFRAHNGSALSVLILSIGPVKFTCPLLRTHI